MKKVENNNKQNNHYTLMLVSDDPNFSTKMYRLPKILFDAILAVFGILIIGLIVFVCVANYRAQLFMAINEQNTNTIARLEAQVKDLSDKKETLQEKSKILSETVSKKLEDEAVQNEKSEPTGYPLSGTADYELKTEAGKKDDGTPTTFVGLEFKAAPETAVTATGAGMVTDVHEDLTYGYQVVVDHGNGYISIYRSGTQPLVKLGDEVSRGAALYVMNPKDEDDTEATTLYYLIIHDGEFIDPTDVLQING